VDIILRNGCVLSKDSADEIFNRVLTAARKWPGLYAVEQLAELALGTKQEITNPEYVCRLYEQRLITTPDGPVRGHQIEGGPEGETASVVTSSCRWASGQLAILCPYRQGPL
jgi:hypothetical protein